eukprot:6200707-Pleurochrysis_carterae.AAC.4
MSVRFHSPIVVTLVCCTKCSRATFLVSITCALNEHTSLSASRKSGHRFLACVEDHTNARCVQRPHLSNACMVPGVQPSRVVLPVHEHCHPRCSLLLISGAGAGTAFRPACYR